jgi:hypothetical protein
MSKHKQSVAQFLIGVASLWGQDCLRLDEQGYCSLRTDDGLDILLEIKDQTDELLFIADLGIDLKEDFAVRLLHENMFAAQWEFATFCRETSQGRVFLRYQYPVDALSEKKLSAMLYNFIVISRNARNWVNAIASGKELSISGKNTVGELAEDIVRAREKFSALLKK